MAVNGNRHKGVQCQQCKESPRKHAVNEPYIAVNLGNRFIVFPMHGFRMPS